MRIVFLAAFPLLASPLYSQSVDEDGFTAGIEVRMSGFAVFNHFKDFTALSGGRFQSLPASSSTFVLLTPSVALEGGRGYWRVRGGPIFNYPLHPTIKRQTSGSFPIGVRQDILVSGYGEGQYRWFVLGYAQYRYELE